MKKMRCSASGTARNCTLQQEKCHAKRWRLVHWLLCVLPTSSEFSFGEVSAPHENDQLRAALFRLHLVVRFHHDLVKPFF